MAAVLMRDQSWIQDVHVTNKRRFIENCIVRNMVADVAMLRILYDTLC